MYRLSTHYGYIAVDGLQPYFRLGSVAVAASVRPAAGDAGGRVGLRASEFYGTGSCSQRTSRSCLFACSPPAGARFSLRSSFISLCWSRSRLSFILIARSRLAGAVARFGPSHVSALASLSATRDAAAAVGWEAPGPAPRRAAAARRGVAAEKNEKKQYNYCVTLSSTTYTMLLLLARISRIRRQAAHPDLERCSLHRCPCLESSSSSSRRGAHLIHQHMLLVLQRVGMCPQG